MITENESTVTRYELKRALTAVAQSVYFVNKSEKQILMDSYFLNFDAMVDFASDNGIDEIEYIRSIRNRLLTCKQTYSGYQK